MIQGSRRFQDAECDAGDAILDQQRTNFAIVGYFMPYTTRANDISKRLIRQGRSAEKIWAGLHVRTDRKANSREKDMRAMDNYKKKRRQ